MASFPQVYLVRHGETAWSLTGQHTGLADIPLTERGEQDARGLSKRLQGHDFSLVLTSPLQRARRTCDLAGFGGVAQLEPDLVEWHYGDYEGLTSEEILARRPDWRLFRDGCPGGEGPADVGARVDRVIAKGRASRGDVLLFSSGHCLRVLAARWCELGSGGGSILHLSTASVSILGYEHNLQEPVIRLWNDVEFKR